LDENGIVRKGLSVVKNDVIIGKISQKSIMEDCSVVITLSEEGIVDDIYVWTDESGGKIVKVKIYYILSKLNLK
jgi:DNA-directed RNA polymerase beta subunit